MVTVTEILAVLSVVPAVFGALVAGDFFQFLYKPSRRLVHRTLEHRGYIVGLSLGIWLLSLVSHLTYHPTFVSLLVGTLLLDIAFLVAGFLFATYIMFPKLSNPTWITAHQADEILSPDDRVIGVAINRDARAFPVDWTFRPHIVEDRIGGESVSMTFCMLSNLGVAYRNQLDGDTMEFIMPIQWQNNMMMYDVRGGRLIQQVEGKVVEGKNRGERLENYPTVIMSWAGWKQLHPETKVLDNRVAGWFDKIVRYIMKNYFIEPNFEDSDPIFPTMERDDHRLPNKTEVIGLTSGKESVVYPVGELEETSVRNETFAGDPIVVVAYPDNEIFTVYSRSVESDVLTFEPIVRGNSLYLKDTETGSVWTLAGECEDGAYEGSRLDTYPHMSRVFWFVWANFYPGTKIRRFS